MPKPEGAICRECGKFSFPLDPRYSEFCDRHCARTYQARRGVPSQEDMEARFSDGVMKLHHEIFDEKESAMGNDKRKLSYLERHSARHSKTSVPPDDHHLSGADKQVVEDEADATVREGARQARAECDRVYEAAEDARKAASCEATASEAKATFWQRMKDFFAGV